MEDETGWEPATYGELMYYREMYAKRNDDAQVALIDKEMRKRETLETNGKTIH